jgi:DNA polymerase III delta prime subunit
MRDHLEKISGRLKSQAENRELKQSILLTGLDGGGKFRLVMDIASTLLCESLNACGKCSGCKRVSSLQHPDFLLTFPFPKIRPESRKNTVFSFSDPVSSNARYSDDTKDEVENYIAQRLENPYAIVEFDKKENIPVEVVKDLIQALSKRPLMGGRRVAAILNVDKMAYGAADLFLKVVEEPPENTHIILTTANPDQLMPTLLSRTSVIKVPPAPVEDIEERLSAIPELGENEVRYIARMSKGSPGLALYLSQFDLAERRDLIFSFFEKILRPNGLSTLVEDVSLEYSGGQYRYNEILMDFEIMESIIHDLYIAGENQLENHLINVDITGKLRDLKAPAMESLDVWKGYCGEIRKACLVNNVSVNSAMVFFYISCAGALNNPVMTDLKLP